MHGSCWQLVPEAPDVGTVQYAECEPAGHTPPSGMASHGGATPPQHGCSQYWVTPQTDFPQAKGTFAGGGAASAPASSVAVHAISSTATDQLDPVQVAIDGPPSAHP